MRPDLPSEIVNALITDNWKKAIFYSQSRNGAEALNESMEANEWTTIEDFLDWDRSFKIAVEREKVRQKEIPENIKNNGILPVVDMDDLTWEKLTKSFENIQPTYYINPNNNLLAVDFTYDGIRGRLDPQKIIYGKQVYIPPKDYVYGVKSFTSIKSTFYPEDLSGSVKTVLHNKLPKISQSQNTKLTEVSNKENLNRIPKGNKMTQKIKGNINGKKIIFSAAHDDKKTFFSVPVANERYKKDAAGQWQKQKPEWVNLKVFGDDAKKIKSDLDGFHEENGKYPVIKAEGNSIKEKYTPQGSDKEIETKNLYANKASFLIINKGEKAVEREIFASKEVEQKSTGTPEISKQANDKLDEKIADKNLNDSPSYQSYQSPNRANLPKSYQPGNYESKSINSTSSTTNIQKGIKI
jgi:hypothetical protein